MWYIGCRFSSILSHSQLLTCFFIRHSPLILMIAASWNSLSADQKAIKVSPSCVSSLSSGSRCLTSLSLSTLITGSSSYWTKNQFSTRGDYKPLWIISIKFDVFIKLNINRMSTAYHRAIFQFLFDLFIYYLKWFEYKTISLNSGRIRVWFSINFPITCMRRRKMRSLFFGLTAQQQTTTTFPILFLTKIVQDKFSSAIDRASDRSRKKKSNFAGFLVTN